MTVGAKVKQTLASLKSVNSTLEIYALQSQNEDSRKAFHESMEMVKTVIDHLDTRIKQLEFEEPQYKGL